MAAIPAEPLFTTARLAVRRLAEHDLDAMHAVYGDADAMRWVGDGQPLARAQCEEWLAVTRRNYATRGYGMNAVVERGSGAVVGFCGLVHPGGQAEAEIKYALLRARWGRGLASELAAALLAHGAAAHGLRRVIATVAPDNLASQRVLRKAGMQRGALRRNDDGSFTQLFDWQPENTPRTSMATDGKDEITWSDTLDGLDWHELEHLYRVAPLGNKSVELLRTVFGNSRFRCFARRQGRLVAAGRALADGADCAYVCDIAVMPDEQGTGVGREVVQRLLQAAKGHKKIILYSVPGKEGFYKKFGFLRLLTAMAIFQDRDAAIERGHLEPP